MSITADPIPTTAQSVPEDGVSLYLREIRSIPMLSEKEEKELALRCSAGDDEAVRRMVSANLRLVVSVAREYAGRGVPLLDLIQEGSIGLLTAAKKFDPALGFRFSTYATKWIRRGILRCLAEQGDMIRVPAYTAEKIRKVQQAENALLQADGTPPTAEQLSEKLNMTADQVKKLLLLEPQVSSLDAPLGEDTTMSMLLEELHELQPQQQLIREELSRILEALFSMLTERQQMVLRLHFGMEDGICHSLEDISNRFGVSKERIRQIERQAMEHLKKNGAEFGLEDFLNE